MNIAQATEPLDPISDGFMDGIGRFQGLRWADVPDDARRIANQCLLDWFGCAIAGSAEPLSRMVRDEVSTNGPCTVFAGGSATVRGAALANGTAGHALDYDDMVDSMPGHASAAILPAVIAVAEDEGIDGAQFMEAFVAGVEVAIRLGRYLSPNHYTIGWHSTGTIGAVGAAAAVARLLDASETEWRTAIALGATQASGLKASFGSMAKPLHAGRASSNGVLAAKLAMKGFTGALDAIDGSQGLVDAAASGSSSPLDDDGRFWIAETRFKYHASCYGTHAAINAATLLRPQLSDPQTEVQIRINPMLLNVCAIAEPQSGLELKFSLRGTVAMTLLGIDTSDIGKFSDETAQDHQLVALRDRIRVVADDQLLPNQTVVTVGEHSAHDDTAVPVTDLVGQEKRLLAKFQGLVEPALGADSTSRLATTLLSLERSSISLAMSELTAHQD